MSQVENSEIFQSVLNDDPKLLQELFTKLGEEECKRIGTVELVHKACAMQKVKIIAFLADKSQQTDWVKQQFQSKGNDRIPPLHYAFRY